TASAGVSARVVTSHPPDSIRAEQYMFVGFFGPARRAVRARNFLDLVREETDEYPGVMASPVPFFGTIRVFTERDDEHHRSLAEVGTQHALLAIVDAGDGRGTGEFHLAYARLGNPQFEIRRPRKLLTTDRDAHTRQLPTPVQPLDLERHVHLAEMRGLGEVGAIGLHALGRARETQPRHRHERTRSGAQRNEPSPLRTPHGVVSYPDCGRSRSGSRARAAFRSGAAFRRDPACGAAAR